jgi:ubiquinone/menaquinone biosynthesis C-methylase UbiE
MPSVTSEARPNRPPSPLAEPGPWNLVSQGYEEVTRAFLEKYSAYGIERLALEREHRVVDVACGPGTSTLLIAPWVGHVDAIDFSEEMLNIARENATRAGLTNVRFENADGQALPLLSGSYDRAVSMFGLMFFPDRKLGMRELRRVLRSGGRALISSWAPVSESPAMTVLFGALRAIDPSRAAPETDVASLENPDVLRAELEEAGFQQVSIEAVPQAMDFNSPESFWDDMVRGAAPLALLRNQIGESEFARRTKIAHEFLRQHLGTVRSLESTAYLAFAAT